MGGLFFSFSHLPFQVYVKGTAFLPYLLSTLPQLGATFLLHLLFTAITIRRKSILIPIALHYALNYLQEVFG